MYSEKQESFHCVWWGGLRADEQLVICVSLCIHVYVYVYVPVCKLQGIDVGEPLLSSLMS